MTLDISDFNCDDIGNTATVTLTVSDESGNQSTCSAAISVQEGVAPTAQCKDITINLDANGMASTTGDAVFDGAFGSACSGASLSLSSSSFDCTDVGTAQTVTLSVIQNNSTLSTCTAGVSITDIAVLVIAGDEGIKPQTIEALEQAKDFPEQNLDRRLKVFALS